MALKDKDYLYLGLGVGALYLIYSTTEAGKKLLGPSTAAAEQGSQLINATGKEALILQQGAFDAGNDLLRLAIKQTGDNYNNLLDFFKHDQATGGIVEQLVYPNSPVAPQVNKKSSLGNGNVSVIKNFTPTNLTGVKSTTEVLSDMGLIKPKITPAPLLSMYKPVTQSKDTSNFFNSLTTIKI